MLPLRGPRLSTREIVSRGMIGYRGQLPHVASKHSSYNVPRYLRYLMFRCRPMRTPRSAWTFHTLKDMSLISASGAVSWRIHKVLFVVPASESDTRQATHDKRQATGDARSAVNNQTIMSADLVGLVAEPVTVDRRKLYRGAMWLVAR